jgi:hypothetical protein
MLLMLISIVFVGLTQAVPQPPGAAVLSAHGATAVLNSSEPHLSSDVTQQICNDCAAAVAAVKTYVNSHIDTHGGTEEEKLAYLKQKGVSEWASDCAADVLADQATETDCNDIFTLIISQGDLSVLTMPNDETCTILTHYACTANKTFLNFREKNAKRCHPASTTLELAGGRFARMDEVQVGDKVRGPSGFEPILGFLHADSKLVGTYIRLTTGNRRAISISPLHLLFINGKATDPSDAAINDLVDTPSGPEPITRIEKVYQQGAFHPFVKGGAYYADGILASDNYGLVPKAVWSLGRAYVEARHWLGVPVIPVGKGFFPNHAWAADSIGHAGMPLWAQKTLLFPLNVASSILTELANVAAERFPVWLGTAAAIAVAMTGRKLRA